MQNVECKIPCVSFRARDRRILAAIAMLFAVGTSVLAWDNARVRDLAPRFHWPDETSNAYFAARIARGAPLVAPEPRNATAENLIHPRTVNVRSDGALVPGAYLGMLWWYGLVGRATHPAVMAFLTPLLAAFGVLAFAAIIRSVAGPTVALLAAALLALVPSMWLFTATTWLPNVPFLALLLLGYACTLGARVWWRWALAGFCIGIALTLRTHEALWVLALLCAVIGQQCRGRSWAAIGSGLLALGSGLVLPFIPILMLQAQLYGSAFTTGYALLREGGAAPTEFASRLLPGWLTALVAPFGWHPVDAAARTWRYLVAPYPWLWALAVIGMAAHRAYRARIMGSAVIIAWLILMYGSWTIADPLVRATNTFTISYVRYWLPVLVLLAAWAGAGAAWIIARVRVRTRAVVACISILAIALASSAQVVRDPSEGLLRQRQALGEHRTRARAVIAATPEDAVIVSHRMDKAFFPERAVVFAAEDAASDAEFVRRLRKLIDRSPVYWYAPGAHVVSGLLSQPVAGGALGEMLYRVQ